MFNPSILRLMAITDGLDGGIDSLVDRAAAACRGGATCIQVRLKDTNARTITQVTRAIIGRVNIPVIVNDRFDIALVSQAAGVHLGADDVSVTEVRRLVPPHFIIGTSVGKDSEVQNSQQADFVGIGPVFPTGSKSDAGNAIGTDELIRLSRATQKPTIAIGGINTTNAKSVATLDVAGIAVIRSIFAATDVELAARTLRTIVDESSPNRHSL